MWKIYFSDESVIFYKKIRRERKNCS
ncbi:hypothetical protein LLE36_06055 [Neisseria gonorrhoeae]|nr:hypothetical protein LLE36_06055 [Neisseria gonorrhoeae]